MRNGGMLGNSTVLIIERTVPGICGYLSGFAANPNSMLRITSSSLLIETFSGSSAVVKESSWTIVLSGLLLVLK
jgi:hypothetical protein